MEEQVSLKDFIDALKKRILLIVLVTLISVIASVVYKYYYSTTIYKASTQILVNQSSGQSNALQLITTYKDLLKSPIILNKVAEDLNLKMDGHQLGGLITILNQPNSQVVYIIVEGTNSDQTLNIANKTAEVFKEQVPSIMNIESNVSILSNATLSQYASISYNVIIIAAAVGLMASIALAFFLEFYNKPIRGEREMIAG